MTRTYKIGDIKRFRATEFTDEETSTVLTIPAKSSVITEIKTVNHPTISKDEFDIYRCFTEDGDCFVCVERVK